MDLNRGAPMRGTVSMTLDLRGLSVPFLVARTAVAMSGLRSGELIEVLTTDPASARDLPVWSRATGNRLVDQTAGDGWYRFIVRKR
jgi:tRNA 2-thiouridine synthesizing protein A